MTQAEIIQRMRTAPLTEHEVKNLETYLMLGINLYNASHRYYLANQDHSDAHSPRPFVMRQAEMDAAENDWLEAMDEYKEVVWK